MVQSGLGSNGLTGRGTAVFGDIQGRGTTVFGDVQGGGTTVFGDIQGREETGYRQVYTGDWCSFEVPDGWVLVSEDESIIVLQGYSGAGAPEYLTVVRFKDVPTTEASATDYLESYTSGVISMAQESGSFGRCTYQETEVYYPPQADFMTVTETCSFRNPNAAVGSYAFGYDTTGQKLGDIIVISLCETGFTPQTWDTTEFASHLRLVYHTFTYLKTGAPEPEPEQKIVAPTFSGSGYSAPIEISMPYSSTTMNLCGVHYDCVSCRWSPPVPARYGMSQNCC